MNRARAVLASLLMATTLAAACSGSPPASAPQTVRTSPVAATETSLPDSGEDESEVPRAGSAPTATPRPLPTAAVSGLRHELVADNLSLPSALTFAPDGRLFFIEVKSGKVRVLDGRTLQADPVTTIATARGSEHGLVGLALDPDFARNHYLYTVYSDARGDSEAARPQRHRLTRWTESRGLASGQTAILDNLPIGKCCHTGGKLAFAADGSLFMTFGDQGDADRRAAQNPAKINGSILHFQVDQVAGKEVDPRSLIYAKGLRNPYGLDIHPVTGAPFVTDNGPDLCDELNLVRPGANFGNPAVECSPHQQGFDDPIWDSGPDRLGLTGLRIYRGAMFPELVNDPLFCSVNTGNLMHAVLSRPGYDTVERVDQVIDGSNGEGCRLDLAVAADGSIYYATMSRIFRLSRG